MNTAQNGKGSKNRLRGGELKKFDESPLWKNLKKDIKKTLCSAGQLRGKRCEPCVCKQQEEK